MDVRAPLVAAIALLAAWSLAACSSEEGAIRCETPPCDDGSVGRVDRDTGRSNDTVASDGSGAAGDAGSVADDAGEDGGDACTPTAETCNGLDDDCDGEVDESPDGAECVDACCSLGLRCNEGVCEALPCGGTRCGLEGELCCEAPDICWGNECFLANRPCEFDDDCPEGELCEPELGVCAPADGAEDCSYRPPAGEFRPEVECRWSAAGLPHPERPDVVGTPIVMNLTDDNRDGRTDRRDTPDIAFLTYDFSRRCCNTAATLRIISGDCSGGTVQTHASISEPLMTNDAGLAAGDLDGDGVPELVAAGLTNDGGRERPQGAMAFRRAADDGSAWELMWHNADAPAWNVHTRGGPLISIADIDASPPAEVIIGNVVLNGLDGSVVWDGAATSSGSGGIGNNAFLGPASVAADVDLDGFQEVIAGNTLYGHDGTPRWTFEYPSSNSPCGGGLPCDGFAAVANFDTDPEAEIVLVRRGEVYILEHTGERLWKAAIPSDDCANNESGPPTIADFDGDGIPEIGTASADFYVVLDRDDCTGAAWEENGCAAQKILWLVPNQDCSSRSTGSSVFDFEGDGRAEVVYADERSFRIFDGPTGEILFDDATHRSHTRIEMPVIADVDNDGNAEIVVPENRSGGGTPGLVVWRDASDNWVRTRRVWNQHGYSITNVSEDGGIPPRPEPNWREPRFNNFRQNVQPSGLFAAPDLELARVEARIEGAKCPIDGELRLEITVRNTGALSVPAGQLVRTIIRNADDTEVELTYGTRVRLFPGMSDVFTDVLPFSGAALVPPLDVEVSVDPEGEVNECREENNTKARRGLSCSRPE